MHRVQAVCISPEANSADSSPINEKGRAIRRPKKRRNDVTKESTQKNEKESRRERERVGERERERKRRRRRGGGRRDVGSYAAD